MAKMIISENRLHELIQESIYEVLQEAQYDEGLGHWLGNAYQTMKNNAERSEKNQFQSLNSVRIGIILLKQRASIGILIMFQVIVIGIFQVS